MAKSWRDRAIEIIAHYLLEYEATQLCLMQPVEWKTCRRYISDRYPWDQRAYTPYKVWCEELKLVEGFLQTGWPIRSYQSWRSQMGRRKPQKQTRPVEGQQSLFSV